MFQLHTRFFNSRRFFNNKRYYCFAYLALYLPENKLRATDCAALKIFDKVHEISRNLLISFSMNILKSNHRAFFLKHETIRAVVENLSTSPLALLISIPLKFNSLVSYHKFFLNLHNLGSCLCSLFLFI